MKHFISISLIIAILIGAMQLPAKRGIMPNMDKQSNMSINTKTNCCTDKNMCKTNNMAAKHRATICHCAYTLNLFTLIKPIESLIYKNYSVIINNGLLDTEGYPQDNQQPPQV